MFGFLNINKPAGPTSHDVVAKVRRLLPRKTKVGHAGTLDPFASGVLVICVGPATRLAEYVQRQPKRYTAQITLGATSSTDDSEGEVRRLEFAVRSEEKEMETVLMKFKGEIQQVPPAHSAVHVDGQRAYKLAREGETVELPPRPVTIHDIQLLRYDWPLIEIDVRCGSGTYIRALARDIGRALGVGGYCSALTRTAVGEFALEQAVSLHDLDLSRDLLPPTTSLDLPTVQLEEDQIARIRHGKKTMLSPSSISNGAAPHTTVEVALLDKAGNLLALARLEEQHLQPTKVLLR